MSQFRRCSRPGCGKPAVATLTYAYSESTAVVGPLAPQPEPHSWDLCEEHAARITAPLGWQMLRVDRIDADDDDEITALAEAVREAGRTDRVTTGLEKKNPEKKNSEDTRDAVATAEASDALSPDISRHPVYRSKRVAAEKQRRRAHLRVVRDGDTY